jgi:hypothetical protein
MTTTTIIPTELTSISLTAADGERNNKAYQTRVSTLHSTL